MRAMFDLSRIASIHATHETRSISAENPSGSPGQGALANVGDDVHCTDAARDLGRGWKVRPCLRLKPGDSAVLCDIEGPGVVQHLWITIDSTRSRLFTLRVYYDGLEQPSIECPVCDFFANGVNGRARIASMPIAVNPTGGMNSYWPMPFRKRIRITITNDWPTPHPTHPVSPLEEFFFQITWSKQPVDEFAGYLHTQWRRTVTAREHPEFTILDLGNARGPGHFVGTYLIWQQHSNGWWGEGEMKFFIDGDGGQQHPTICGTGTEDYFGGAWGFAEPDEHGVPRPIPFTTNFLGYPQAIIDRQTIPVHGLYRWHIPDPVRFRQSLRVTCQALGWWPTRRYQPLADDIVSMAFWYAREPAWCGVSLPDAYGRLLR